MASLWNGSGLGLPKRNFEVVGDVSHVGARFEALEKSILKAHSLSPGIFFTILAIGKIW